MFGNVGDILSNALNGAEIGPEGAIGSAVVGGTKSFLQDALSGGTDNGGTSISLPMPALTSLLI
ncbi:hypothetical protein [Burkholderia territorii]|uniref:hypothetical protein n=1 Tax=Burkholderia territorii TaxID=1503055 RepID=UPI000AC08B63|nr:hypothetical protein [Burkholderia territorii]